MPATRSSQEIRRSIQSTRTELTGSVEALQGKVREAADWRGHLRDNPRLALGIAVGAGFVLGGGLAGLFAVLSRRA
jgi:hypothetical protein